MDGCRAVVPESRPSYNCTVTLSIFSIIIAFFCIEYRNVYHFIWIGLITVRITDPPRIVCRWYENSFMTSADAYSSEGKVVHLCLDIW
jgi:hypothetical protein